MKDNKRTLTPELEEMEVYGETRVGWDENTPVNETVDANGNVPPGNRGFGCSRSELTQTSDLRRPRGGSTP